WCSPSSRYSRFTGRCSPKCSGPRLATTRSSYLTPSRTHSGAGFLDTKLARTLHTPGVYGGIFLRQTRRTPPKLVAKPAAFSRRIAHLLFLRSHSRRGGADAPAPF